MAITWTGAGVFGTIGKIIKTYNQTSIKESSLQSESVKMVKAYLKWLWPVVSGSTYTSLTDLLDVLYDEMTDDTQSIDGNAVAAGAVTFVGSGSNHIVDAAAVYGQVTATQMLKDDDLFRIECTRASVGADTWRVYSMWRGLLSDVCTTGTLYNAGGISFTIEAPDEEFVNDGGVLLDTTTTSILGGVNGTNCDTEGTVYVYIEDDGYGNYTLTLYPSAADRTAGTNAVGHVDYTAIGDQTLVADNSSGLSGTIGIAILGTDTDIEIVLAIAYVVGDLYKVAQCTVTDDGVIQSFFRDELDYTLPYQTDGSETIPDSLAE